MQISELQLQFTSDVDLPFQVAERKLASKPLDHFQVFGERNSGTNFVSHLIDKNTDLEMVGRYGWKHGFPVAVAYHPRSLIVFVYRDPIDWLVSMYNRPYAASKTVKFSDFSAFLRSEWGSFLRANSFLNWSQKWNATIVDELDGDNQLLKLFFRSSSMD